MENKENFIEGKLVVEGVEYNTLLTKKYQERKAYEEPNLNKIEAFISGTIRQVFVKDGAKVKEGDVLLSLEAMKMNNLIKAPANGVIKKVYVKEDEHVTKGDLLVELS